MFAFDGSSNVDLPLLRSIVFGSSNSFTEVSYAVVLGIGRRWITSLESSQFHQYLSQFEQIQNKYIVLLSGSGNKEARLYVQNPEERTIWSISDYYHSDTILLPREVIYVEMKSL